MNNYKQYIYNEFTTPKINFRKKRKQKQIVNNTTTTPYNSWTNNRLILNNNLWNSFSRPGTCTDGCQPNFQYDNINSPYKWNFNNNEQLNALPTIDHDYDENKEVQQLDEYNNYLKWYYKRYDNKHNNDNNYHENINYNENTKVCPQCQDIYCNCDENNTSYNYDLNYDYNHNYNDDVKNNNRKLEKPHFCELCGLDVTVCRCRGFKSSHFCELCGLDINVCRCRGYKSPCNKCQYDHCICEDPNYEDDYNNNHNNDNNTNEQMCPTCGYYECMCAQLKCGVCHKIVCICDNNDHYELCQCPECQSIPIKDPNNLNNHFNNDQYDHNQHNNGQYENNQYNNDQYNDGQYDNNKYNDNDHYELCQCPECQSIPIKNPNILNNNK